MTKKKLIIIFVFVLLVAVALAIFGTYAVINRKSPEDTPVQPGIEVELRIELEKITKQKESLQAEVKDLNDIIKQKEEDINYWYNKYDERWLELQTITNENDTLKQQLQEIHDSYKSIIDEYKTTIAQLKLRVAELESEVAELNAQLNTVNAFQKIELNFTEEQLQHELVKKYLSGHGTHPNIISTFSNVKDSYKKENEVIIVSNVLDGDGKAGSIAYVWFNVEEGAEVSADYIYNLMTDVTEEIIETSRGPITKLHYNFNNKIIADGCLQPTATFGQSDYAGNVDYYTNNQTSKYLINGKIFNINDIYLMFEDSKVVNDDYRSVNYSIIIHTENNFEILRNCEIVCERSLTDVLEDNKTIILLSRAFPKVLDRYKV